MAEVNMPLTVLNSLDDIPAADWNSLAGEANPFLRHEFLAALERHRCVGAEAGWIPQHLVLHEQGKLVGAVPMYLKDNSYGEFVFDWAWADAYRRAGLSYYPKLVVAVPYTPATGARLLLAEESPRIADVLIEGALEHAQRLKVSSLHWLFTTEQDTRRLESHGLMRRTGCQFHWHNQTYRDFDDFLAQLTAEKRKKVKRERRYVREAGIEIEVLNGRQISAEQWEIFHRFYSTTFQKRGGLASLGLEFFQEIGQTLADNVVLVLAKHHGRYVAGAFNLRGTDTLYGRHWGCCEEFHSLHFEVCYYAAIEHCIALGLTRFEAGAQGEHKLSRGFLPTPTWSAHWLSHPAFSRAVEEFLSHEQDNMAYYMNELGEHTPYRQCATGHL
ncbi:MAG: GNAT family N-acetyltransferase [Gammaproteobacteria bacterium]